MTEIEHAAALADARAQIESLDRPPLAPLPAGYSDGLAVLHAVAEETMQERRRDETGSGWLRPFTPGGVGAPAWERGERSGEPGSIAVIGTELIAVSGDEERRSPLVVEADVTAALADLHAFATAALGALVETVVAEGDAADPIRLWPEHFDVATTIGDEGAGTRANAGVSPGDENHPQPYVYFGPWAEPAASPFWNATGFTGAELAYDELLEAEDQVATALAFLLRGRELLRG
jgi:hypothetical protein